MPENIISSCAVDWGSNRVCLRNPRTFRGRCRTCHNQIKKGQNDDAASITRARPFPKKAVEERLYETRGPQSVQPLDTHGLDPSILQLDIHRKLSDKLKSKSKPALDADQASSPSLTKQASLHSRPPSFPRVEPSVDGLLKSPPKVELSLEFRGPFNTENVAVTRLDEAIVKDFSGNLKAKSGDAQPIATTVLAGGYLHMLCSSGKIQKQVRTYIDRVPAANDHSGDNIDLPLRFLLMCRCGELIDEVMEIIRSASERNMHAYAASVILHFEVKYFIQSLRNGTLSQRIPPGIEGAFLDWLASIEVELKNRLVEGCGRFPTWSSVIKGSLKDFKNLRHKDEVLTIVVYFQQNKSGPRFLEHWDHWNLPNQPSPEDHVASDAMTHLASSDWDLPYQPISVVHDTSHGLAHLPWIDHNQPIPVEYDAFNGMTQSPPAMSFSTSHRSQSSSLGYFDPGLLPPEETSFAMTASRQLQTPPNALDGFGFQFADDCSIDLWLWDSTSDNIGAEAHSDAKYPSLSNLSDGKGDLQYSSQLMDYPQHNHKLHTSDGKPFLQSSSQPTEYAHYGSSSQISDRNASMQFSSQPTQYPNYNYTAEPSNGKHSLPSSPNPRSIPRYASVADVLDDTTYVDPQLPLSNYNTPTIKGSNLSLPGPF